MQTRCLDDLRRHSGWRRQAFGLAKLAALLCWAPAACSFDSEHPCGENQQVYRDNVLCVCDEGYALTAKGCVACGENEVPGADGCVCALGFTRPSPAAACVTLPTGLGEACDTAGAACMDAAFPHCELVSDTSGYCTTTNCESPADCSGGYACDTAADPTVCRRPPVGLGKPCESAADCAGTEATFCDTRTTHTCLVEGCSLTENDCFGGMVCCDLSQFGLMSPLCLSPGSC